MYTDLKKIFDKMNFDKSHFINSNDICTPMNCVEEMLDAIPSEFWKRKNIEILDPCAGNGNFPLYAKELLNRNNNEDYTLYINEVNKKRRRF